MLSDPGWIPACIRFGKRHGCRRPHFLLESAQYVRSFLREGFQDWAKFGITAFATFDKRKFQLPAQIPGLSYDPEYGSGLNASPSTIEFPITQVYDEFSTYIGAEISKRRGNILTYNARGELCVVGDDIGEFRATGNLQTKFKLLKKMRRSVRKDTSRMSPLPSICVTSIPAISGGITEI